VFKQLARLSFLKRSAKRSGPLSDAGPAMPPPSYEQVLAIVRAEIRKYLNDDFGDDQTLLGELKIDSDDLSFIAADLEKRLKVKVPQSDYDHVATAADLARALYRKAASLT
jgi:acyl carrier protein